MLYGSVAAPSHNDEKRTDRSWHATDFYSSCHWHIKAPDEHYKVGLELVSISDHKCTNICHWGYLEIKNKLDMRPAGMRYVFLIPKLFDENLIKSEFVAEASSTHFRQLPQKQTLPSSVFFRAI
jgi:hypothetical protein